jgi:hypothetical protein
MSLREDIQNFMEQFLTQVPPDIQKTMREESEQLANSGIADNCLKVGDKAPMFSLPNGFGQLITSEALLWRGPLVVSFYRGGW